MISSSNVSIMRKIAISFQTMKQIIRRFTSPPNIANFRVLRDLQFSTSSSQKACPYYAINKHRPHSKSRNWTSLPSSPKFIKDKYLGRPLGKCSPILAQCAKPKIFAGWSQQVPEPMARYRINHGIKYLVI